MRREHFPVSGPIRLEVATGSGDIQLLGGDEGEAIVELRGGPEDEYLVELNGSDLVVRPPVRASGKRRFARTNIKVYLPGGTTAAARTASGDITTSVELHGLDAATASGNIRISDDVAEDVHIKTASGDVRLQNVGGDAGVATASGTITIDGIGGDFRVNSASGDIRVHSVGGIVEAKSSAASTGIGTGSAASPSSTVASP